VEEGKTQEEIAKVLGVGRTTNIIKVSSIISSAKCKSPYLNKPRKKKKNL